MNSFNLQTLYQLYLRLMIWLGAAPPAVLTPLPRQILQHQKDWLAFSTGDPTKVKKLDIPLIISRLSKFISILIAGLFILAWISALFSPLMTWPIILLGFIVLGCILIAPPLLRVVKENRLAGQALKNLEIQLRHFAAHHQLVYLSQEDAHWIYGEYREHEFVCRLDRFQKELSITCSRLASIRSSLKNADLLEKSDLLDTLLTTEAIIRLFNERLRNPMIKPIKFEADGRKLFYEERDFWCDQKSLQTLFETLINFADNYASCCASIIILGGESVAALQRIARDGTSKLQGVAIILLREIGWQTTSALSQEAPDLFCKRCLSHCAAHQVQLSFGQSITYYGCRICGQSRQFFSVPQGNVIVVLDGRMDTVCIQDQDRLRVNWLIRRQLFDFGTVEIKQAGDEEVERFAVQVGNDTDEIRKVRYSTMSCFVSSDCELSENTMRILGRMFGQVSVQKEM